MSKRYFFDTSALIKLYHNETGTDTLNNLISSDDPDIVISDLTVIEMISALAKKVRMKSLDDAIFKEAIAEFESDVALFTVVVIEETIKKRAMELLKNIGKQKGLKTLDALQLACAIKTLETESIDLFVVADKTLGEISEDQGLNILTV